MYFSNVSAFLALLASAPLTILAAPVANAPSGFGMNTYNENVKNAAGGAGIPGGTGTSDSGSKTTTTTSTAQATATGKNNVVGNTVDCDNSINVASCLLNNNEILSEDPVLSNDSVTVGDVNLDLLGL